jgi:hypothetical protein
MLHELRTTEAWLCSILHTAKVCLTGHLHVQALQ